jgi:hypothetical protein
MPPTVEDRLQNILDAIQEIEAMLAGMSFEQFSADNIRRMAAERYLESHAKRRDTFPMMSNSEHRKLIGAG